MKSYETGQVVILECYESQTSIHACTQESAHCIISWKIKGVCLPWEKQKRSSKPVREACIKKPQSCQGTVQVFATVLLNFHSSSDKTGLGDRKNQSREVLKILDCNIRITSSHLPAAPRHLQSTWEGWGQGTATGNVLLYLLSWLTMAVIIGFQSALQSLRLMEY